MINLVDGGGLESDVHSERFEKWKVDLDVLENIERIKELTLGRINWGKLSSKGWSLFNLRKISKKGKEVARLREERETRREEKLRVLRIEEIV